MLLTLIAISVAPQTLVLKNANVVTLDPNRPRAEAVVCRDGKILFVGSNGEASKYEPGAQVVDLHRHTVVPGMTDSHFHLTGVGEREMELNLEGINSLEGFLSKIKEQVSRAKPKEWVVGSGWIETFWKPPVFPTRFQLDAVSPNNPVFLVRADGHAAVVNSMALKLAGVTRSTKDPSGGEFSKDKNGEPNGMVLDHAISRFRLLVPQPNGAKLDDAVIRGSNFAIEHGWCEVQVAGGSWDDVERLRRLYRDGKVKVRVYQAVYGPGSGADKLFSDGPVLGEFGGRLTVRDIKVVADGALGSRGAFLLAPYADKPDTRGFLTVKREDVVPMMKTAYEKGIQVEVHAIGDAANREILDWMEEAFASAKPNERRMAPRWRIEHAQNVTSEDIPRFKALGIIPSMQPSHAISDLHFAPARLGMERLSEAYAWKSLLDTGSIICGGSDTPVERGDPLIEFYAAVARKDLKGFSGPGWHLEQRVSREQALKMFTKWAAYAAFEEKVKGTIQVGKVADFTIFDRDIMSIPEDQIPSSKCVMTIVGGEIVFQRK